MRRDSGYFEKSSVLALFNQGDKRVFEEAYNFFAPRLYRHALLRTGSREVAEEITSETFLRVWNYISRGSGILNLRVFLFRTLHHLIIDFYRERKKRGVAISDSLLDSLVQDETSKDKIDQEEQKRFLLKALDNLRTEYRLIITWRYIDELSVREIGQVAGKSANAVYVALHRALKALRAVIDKMPDFPL